MKEKMPPARDGGTIRRPVQQRGRERFDAILDVADTLLASFDPREIGVHQLAGELGISAATIYHFFPEPSLIFQALAERYISDIEALNVSLSSFVPDTWQDVQTQGFRLSMDYFNNNVAARKVILGSAASYDIRIRDFESDRVLAEGGLDNLRRHFILPEDPGLVDRCLEVIVINDAIWSLSIYRHGIITEGMEEQARRARIAYGRTFLPEYLPRRER